MPPYIPTLFIVALAIAGGLAGGLRFLIGLNLQRFLRTKADLADAETRRIQTDLAKKRIENAAPAKRPFCSPHPSFPPY